MNMQVNSWPLHILWIKYPIILGNKQIHATWSTCFYFFHVDEQNLDKKACVLDTLFHVHKSSYVPKTKAT